VNCGDSAGGVRSAKWGGEREGGEREAAEEIVALREELKDLRVQLRNKDALLQQV